MESEGTKTKGGDEIEEDDDPGHDLTIYSVHSIVTATDNFSLRNKLGQGGFGHVYKGKLSGGREVAVKKLSKRSDQGLVEFRNEPILIAKLQHRNLVSLLGCCIHGEEKMLVYEYMPNKSLDFFVFDESKRSLLCWNKRFIIIEGIAQGLLYLHKHSRVKIIHRDLKVGNILLDENLNPNILEANTNRPYAMNGTFSTKSDVFGFRIMLLEIVSGRKNYHLIQLDPAINLVGYAWKLWKEGTPLLLMDPTMSNPHNYKDEILRCINIGLLCIEYNASDRPSMSEVISMLTNEVEPLPVPKQPGFTMTRTVSIGKERREPENCSANEVTMTSMSPR
ncbi:unnamed protein product [Linum tenue]|uniref:non-specific serine/threonine protein kinase n=1 Tax=Linum tenue TaxID=586396 RepID=A0AAV0L6T0_9ROSI|nr:unnamed protein product [Linum tenue]